MPHGAHWGAAGTGSSSTSGVTPRNKVKASWSLVFRCLSAFFMSSTATDSQQGQSLDDHWDQGAGIINWQHLTLTIWLMSDMICCNTFKPVKAGWIPTPLDPGMHKRPLVYPVLKNEIWIKWVCSTSTGWIRLISVSSLFHCCSNVNVRFHVNVTLLPPSWLSLPATLPDWYVSITVSLNVSIMFRLVIQHSGSTVLQHLQQPRFSDVEHRPLKKKKSRVQEAQKPRFCGALRPQVCFTNERHWWKPWVKTP